MTSLRKAAVAAVLLLTFTGVTLSAGVATAAAANRSFGSRFIEAVVNDQGYFTIGTREGDPSLASDDNRILLYGHPNPSTSFTSVKVDGQSAKLYDTRVLSGRSVSADAASMRWRYNGVDITQVLSIVTGPVTGRPDTVRIAYTLQNNSGDAHEAGLRIMLDTMLGANDGAPFRIPGVGSVTNEMAFRGREGGAIPDYLQAFDSLESPGVVAHASILDSRLGEQPDSLLIASWPGIMRTVWDYQIDSSVAITHDSAMAVYWDARPLRPGESRSCVIEYGITQLVQDLKPPLATAVSPLRRPLPSTGDALSIYVQNNSTRTVHNAAVEVTLPDGLAFEDNSRVAHASLGTIEPGQEAQQSTFRVHPTDVVLTRARQYSYSVKISGDEATDKRLQLSTEVDHNIPKKDGRPLNPIVIVPGVLGSWNTDKILHATDVSAPAFWRTGMVQDPTKNQLIVSWQIDPVNHTYDNLISRLKANGYEVGKTLFFAPYDWRIPNSVSAQDYLKPVVEYATQQKFGGHKVILVAHSMGGIVCQSYLARPQNRSRVAALLQIATPNEGSADSYYTWEGADKIEIAEDRSIVRPLLQCLAVKMLAQHYNSLGENWRTVHAWFPSIGDLLPTFDFLVSPSQPGRISRGVGDMYYKNLRLPGLAVSTREAMASVEIAVVAGTGVKTIRYIPVGAPAHSPEREYADGQPLSPAIAVDGGDGTVLLDSARIEGASLTTVNATHEEVVGREDLDKPTGRGKNALNAIAGLLDLPKEGAYKSFKQLDMSRGDLLALFISCPVKVTAMDASGTPLIDMSTTTTPQPYFYNSLEGSAAVLLVPNPGRSAYRLDIRGTKDGTCTVSTFLTASNETTSSKHAFDVSANSVHRFDVKTSQDASGRPTLTTTLSDETPASGSGWVMLVALLVVAGGAGAAYVVSRRPVVSSTPLDPGVDRAPAWDWAVGESVAQDGDKSILPKAAIRGGNGTVLLLLGVGETALIGRDSGARLRLDDPKVSAEHATVSVSSQDGRVVVMVTDLGSTNGSFIAGRKLGAAATGWPAGAELRVGGTKIAWAQEVRD